MLPDIHGKLYSLFAGLLEYPTTALCLQVEEAASILHEKYRENEMQLTIFQEYVNSYPLATVEELYTRTFDLQGLCCPYVGHHLFGESSKRSQFMARLNQEYHTRQFSAETELPDHVSVILRFLGLSTANEFSQTLACEGLIPALTRMLDDLAPLTENPYRYVLQAILDVLSYAFTMPSASAAGSATGEVNHA